MTYTDEDVVNLLNAATDGYNIAYKAGVELPEIPKALAPFRPDPEEELIEAMCHAFDNVWHAPNYDPAKDSEPYRKARMESMSAALAVVKERGLTK